MTQRLPLLLVLLAAIVALRWWDPIADSTAEVVQAVARSDAIVTMPRATGGTASASFDGLTI